VTLTVVRTNPAGGTGDSSPTGISCGTICSAQFDPGTPIQLTATADSAYFQKGWSGAGCSGHGVCSFVINADTTISADLVPKVTVYADVGAGNGTVEVSAPSAPYGVCTGLPPTTCTVLQGDEVTVAATADTGSHFDQWTGDCAGTIATSTFTAIDPPDKSCHASFAINTYSVSVQKSGGGAGQVSSSPTGISCGLTCSASFPYGSVVTLSASADSGSTFAGWSGACSGVGTCSFTVSAAVAVSATFDPT
jgi:Divergent InlB B-repeat domain